MTSAHFTGYTGHHKGQCPFCVLPAGGKDDIFCGVGVTPAVHTPPVKTLCRTLLGKLMENFFTTPARLDL